MSKVICWYKAALRKYDQCTPQTASSTTDSRAPNFFHIQAARVKASILGITTKKCKGRETIGNRKAFSMMVKILLYLSNSWKNLHSVGVYFIPPSVVPFSLYTFFFFILNVSSDWNGVWWKALEKTYVLMEWGNLWK